MQFTYKPIRDANITLKISYSVAHLIASETLGTEYRNELASDNPRIGLNGTVNYGHMVEGVLYEAIEEIVQQAKDTKQTTELLAHTDYGDFILYVTLQGSKWEKKTYTVEIKTLKAIEEAIKSRNFYEGTLARAMAN